MDIGEGSINEVDIYNEFGQALEDGDTWYLLSTKWSNKWKDYAGITKSSGENPGPIDNSGILKDNVLQDHLVDSIEYELVPEDAWKKLVNLYGITDGQDAISRKAIKTGSYSNTITVEIYPPEIRMKQHGDDANICKENFSRCTTIKVVHEKMRKLFKITDSQKTRVYIRDSVDSIDENDTLDKAGVGPTQILVLEKQNTDGTWPRTTIPPPSYNEATTSSASSSTSKTKNNFYSTSSSGMNGSGYGTRSSSNSFWGSSKRDTPGLCGLSNLGNTCFMNSAIQCLSNVPPLTMYFQDKKYLKELNRKNPIGMKGRLAESYAALIHDIWSGYNSSVSPRDFKYNVSSFAPQFSGYQQHDSQELLAFLIDGLHEDLNRIEVKPYVELKDSDNRLDQDVADEAWKNHLRRNNSIIVDMFHGLFKSTIVCPDCDRVSITFDPFGFLSLPLPRAKDMSVVCNFMPRDPSKPVTRHTLSLPKDGCMKDICKALASRMECKAEHLIITDVYNYRFYKIYRGNERISLYSDRDNLFVFQLGFEEDYESEDDTQIEYAKVYMRQKGQINVKLFAHPFLIPVKPGKTTYRKFYNSVLAGVSRYVKKEYRDNVKMLSELRKCELNESVGSDVDGNEIGDAAKEQDEVDGEEEEIQWFKLVTINSFGTTTLKELSDNDKPIKFTGETYFSAEWDSKTCDEYAVEDWSKTFELDPSMMEKPVRDKGISLQQCMKLFTSKEKLGEHDLWYCPQCKEHKQATKKFDLWTLPPILIIHLKRFSYTRWSRDKISTYVDFPTRDLDLSDFIINPAKNQWEANKKRYNLIGVSNHYGGMGGGHYTAYALNYPEDKWYYFDDSSVSESSEDKVQTKAAYLLMYQRQDIMDGVREGRKRDFNFLESTVSPRSCNEGFAYDVNAKMQRSRFQNGSESSPDRDIHVASNDDSAMDTS